MPKVSVRTCVADVIKAIDYFTESTSQILNDAGLSCNADLNNVYLIGDSAGAHIASLIAAKATCGELKLKCNISALGLYYGVYAFENISHDPSPIMTGLDKYWKSIYVNTHINLCLTSIKKLTYLCNLIRLTRPHFLHKKYLFPHMDLQYCNFCDNRVAM